MRASFVGRSFACLACIAITADAIAEPPANPKNVGHASTATVRRNGVEPVRASVEPGGVHATASKQVLVGWHAPSAMALTRDAAGRPMLALTMLNRSESLVIPAAGEDGAFETTELDRAAHFLRAATGEQHPIDPRTLSMAYRIQTHFGVPEIRVVSAYRVPRPGSRSNHGKGRAMDIVVPGVADEDVARFARELGFVGVGVYPSSQFVHVDIRPRSYFWIDFSGPRRKNHEHCVLADLAARSDAAAVARGQQPVEPFAVATDVDRALRARGLVGAKEQADDETDEDE
jgi:uncharacterized protein YcbK (DUF882 family)